MKYNLSRLMRKAWRLFKAAAKKNPVSFSSALRLAWKWAKAEITNVAKIEAAAEGAGIVESYHSWSGWLNAGRQVIHGQQAAFKVEILDPTTKKGCRVKSYFTFCQTEPISE